MAYQYSQTDKSNLGWFEKDASKATLVRMELNSGPFRGLNDIKIHFKYPITAISGKNGTGKSTLLGCAACAFHNSTYTGFRPYLRRYPFYRFSDFFVRSSGESSPTGHFVSYEILHNKWRRSKAIPTGTGLGWQWRKKSYWSQMWNRYSTRVTRNVAYLGIERVLPHIEKSVSKSYRQAFKREHDEGYEKKVCEAVSKTIGRPYEEFYFKKHLRYRLPFVKSRGRTYSGFNMGAGEKALFEIFSTIFACEGSLLLVIDEIELGLHEEAQIRLIEQLKHICKQRHIQIICTTHSSRVLKCLPPEARIHLEKDNNVVTIIPEISAEYAAGLMSGEKHAELDIFCEDNVAKSILLLALPNNIRSRVEIIPIGSHNAVLQQMAARFKEINSRACCCFLDGDQAKEKSVRINQFLNSLENEKYKKEAELWIEKRLNFLPGDTWPEDWVLSSLKKGTLKKLSKEFGLKLNTLSEYVEVASMAGKHDELHELAARLNLPVSRVEGQVIKFALEQNKAKVRKMVRTIQCLLD